MIGTLRRWSARVIALVVTVLTLGMVEVQWDGVGATANARDSRPPIGAELDPADSGDDELPAP